MKAIRVLEKKDHCKWACEICSKYLEFFKDLDAFPDQLLDQYSREDDYQLVKNRLYLHIKYTDNSGMKNSKIVPMPDCLNYYDFNNYGVIPREYPIYRAIPYKKAKITVIALMPESLFKSK
jgi:hypothetical protein